MWQKNRRELEWYNTRCENLCPEDDCSNLILYPLEFHVLPKSLHNVHLLIFATPMFFQLIEWLNNPFTVSCHALMISWSHYHLLWLLPLSSSQHRISPFIYLPFLLPVVGTWPCGRLHGCTSHSVAKSRFDGRNTCCMATCFRHMHWDFGNFDYQYMYKFEYHFKLYRSSVLKIRQWSPKRIAGQRRLVTVTSKRNFKRRIWKGTPVKGQCIGTMVLHHDL